MPKSPARPPRLRRRDRLARSSWVGRAMADEARFEAGGLASGAEGPQQMRYPGKPAVESAAAAAPGSPAVAAITVPAAAVIAYHRLAFGPRPGDVDAFDALGASDTARLTAWIDQQLMPAAINDAACDARLAQSAYQTLGKTLAQLWADHEAAENVDWKFRLQPFYETRLATFVRAIHSKRQLLEVVVDFWHNHWNVYGDDGNGIGSTWVHTDRDAIRAHALGNFRQMLGAVAKTPAMLVYLDNFDNSQDGLNENYSREVQELHTLGSENYYGNMAAAAVPRDAQNRPLGYCDEDVTEMSKCLTGWTIRNRPWDGDFGDTGAFFTYEPWHTPGAKTLLGVTINQGSALADGEKALDVLAQHPGTSRFIARKLARRLLGDNPPQAVVDAAAATFAANVQAADQIAKTIRTIVLRPEFLATWGDKAKRPFDFAATAVRTAGGDLPFQFNTDPLDWIYVDGDGSFFWMYEQCGQPLFGWHPPNGYPDSKHAWKATSPRVAMWRLANAIVQLDDGNGNHYVDVVAQTPAAVRSAEEIANYWATRVLGQLMPPSEQQELVEFMAAGHNPTFDLPLATDEDTQERLRAMVALIWMSPSYLYR